MKISSPKKTPRFILYQKYRNCRHEMMLAGLWFYFSNFSVFIDQFFGIFFEINVFIYVAQYVSFYLQVFSAF